MFTRRSTIIVWAAILLVPIAFSSSGISGQASAIDAGNGPVICSVMEAFDEGKLGVRAIVFHQRDKADGPRLGSLLLSHSGEEMELQSAGGQRYQAAVFRVKSAFGRGLVLIPISKFKLGEHDEFTLRLPVKNGSR